MQVGVDALIDPKSYPVRCAFSAGVKLLPYGVRFSQFVGVDALIDPKSYAVVDDVLIVHYRILFISQLTFFTSLITPDVLQYCEYKSTCFPTESSVESAIMYTLSDSLPCASIVT